MAQQSWTGTITAGVTIIDDEHFSELKNAINAWETAYSITNTTWTASTAEGQVYNNEAVNELKSALENLESLSGGTLPNGMTTRSDEDLGRAVDINNVRANINYLQDQQCYQCHTCDNYSACSCDNTCYEYSSCTCDSSCYSYTACSCNNTCYNQHCTCNAACYGCNTDDYGSCSCHGTCYQQSCSCNNTCYSFACSCNSTCYEESAGCSCNSTCYEYNCGACYSTNYAYPWT